jgi:hypothetical protein
MINEVLLQSFMNTFMGYGDLCANTWFVGMEEGGGNSLEDIKLRIEMWEARGCRTIEDCAEYHNAIGEGHLFNPPLGSAQRTWDWLMRAQLVAECQKSNALASKRLQAERWLRHGSGTCAIELLPLPSPSVSVWHYSKFSKNPLLQDRDSYKAAMLPSRINTIKSMISAHRPHNVLFYGKQYLSYWKEISGLEFLDSDGIGTARSVHTNFICAIHPTAPIKGAGKKISYWNAVGERIMVSKTTNDEQ